MYIEIKETISKKDVIPQQKQAGPVKLRLSIPFR